jgi:predicted Zn-dependent peptidase
VSTASTAAIPASPRELQYKPLNFQRPKPQKHVLKNGMTIFLLEDHALPIVTGNLRIRTGQIYDPEDKVGLAELTGATLRTGGTAKRTGDEIDQRLEFLGARIETGIAREEGTASLWTMSKDLDETLGLLAEILRQPRFADEKIDLRKKSMAERVRRQNDEPDEIIEREFTKLVYASSPAWGRTPTLKSIESLTRNDAAAFYKQFVHPNLIIAGFAGDFDSAKMLAKIEELFGDWPRQDAALPKLAPVAEKTEPALNVISKDLPQSYVQLGHLGMRRHDPNRYAAVVMNFILGWGGNFTSRIMMEVRTARGLAYDASSNLGEGADRGVFRAEVQTKSESTWEAVQVIVDLIRKMATSPIADEELDKAKSAIVNQFVFRFDKPQDTINEVVRLEYYGYPEDYLDKFIERIQAVTKEDVQRAAKAYLHPEQTIILIVGNPKQFGEAPKELGPMKEIKLE